MKIEYTIATKGIHGGYSNINKHFTTINELQAYLEVRKNKSDYKIVKITWINAHECKEEYI